LTSIVSKILFWPETFKLRATKRAPSRLTQLSIYSSLKFFEIAFRPSRTGKEKKVIRLLAFIKTFSIILHVSLLSTIVFEPIYHISSIFSLAVICVIISLVEILYWNDDVEKSLLTELRSRDDEMSSPYSGSNIIHFPKVFSGRGEAQNVSALRERTESDMEWTQNDIDDYDGLCSRMNAMAAKGRQLLENIKKQEPDFAAKNIGKYVQVNINTGEYVLASSLSEANDEFSRRFGAGSPCFNEHIGHPVYARNPLGNIHEPQRANRSS
jgi:hypothetical protein